MSKANSAFIPGPCPHCEGSGQIGIAWITPAGLAEILGLTERRLRQLAVEGHIPKLVRGKGYPVYAIQWYTDYIVRRRA